MKLASMICPKCGWVSYRTVAVSNCPRCNAATAAIIPSIRVKFSGRGGRYVATAEGYTATGRSRIAAARALWILIQTRSCGGSSR